MRTAQILFLYLLLSPASFSQGQNLNSKIITVIKNKIDPELGEDFYSSQSERETLSTYEKSVRNTLKLVPSSELRKGLQSYVEILGSKEYRDDVDVGGGNAGLSAFFKNTLTDNPCFRKIAVNFYRDISEEDDLLAKKNNYFSEDPLGGRPSLARSLNKGAYKNHPEGWLLKRAMNYANQNPLIAMSLIGICGHDDINQGDYRFITPSEDTKKNYSKEGTLRAIQSEIERVQDMIDYYGDAKENREKSHFYKVKLTQWKIFQSRVETSQVKVPVLEESEVICPVRESLLYVPKGLGKEVDLPEEFKQKIAQIQAPTKGMQVIPAKNYHILASAFLGCKLAEKGIKPKMAATIQKVAAWGYRTLRMSEYIKNKLKTRTLLLQTYRNEMKDYKEKNKVQLKTSRGIRWKYPTVKPFDEWLYDNSEKEISKDDGYFYEKFEDKESANLYIEKLDAAYLMDEMTLGGGNLFGMELPHTNLTLNFGVLSKKEITLGDKNPQLQSRDQKRNNSRTQHGLPLERFNRAKRKVNTLLIEWEWTTKQHEVGAGFGAKFCSKLPDDFELDDVACGIISGVRTGSCKSTSDKISVEKINSVIKDHIDTGIKANQNKNGNMLIENLY